jgi:tetratricopeptide (TPR) repeat protein
LANAIMPHLYTESLDKERADFFVKLLKPSFNTKMEDFLHFLKLPAEPDDWSVQTGYSLANLRAGNFSTAGKENKKLIKKASKFDKITELKELHLHRALIEAHDGKEKEARNFLDKALEMNSSTALDPNSQKLVKETERALAKLKK